MKPVAFFASSFLASLAFASPLLAQCPDGSPPPCRSTASLAGRVPALALNDNTWLILPFDNTARSADAELIRQASVTQLSGEMSRWQGVRVISDDRLADLLQQLPAAQRDRPGLDAATTLARRVGAGRIVLGSYLALGGRANLTVKVYETRSGRELKSVRDALAGMAGAAALDSLGATFGRLARAILDVPAGQGSASAGIGTSSVEAYRAYVAGMDAINRIDIPAAHAALDRAIQLDSGFALAYYQRWRFSTDSASRQSNYAATMRLLDRLPPRARALAEAQAAARSGDRATMCRSASQVLAADSSDFEGWGLLSTCLLDQTVVVENGRARIKGSPTQALRAAEREYALAPASVLAFSSLISALQQGSTMQCTDPSTPICPPDQYYRVSLVPSGDTIGVVVSLWREVRSAPPDLAPAAVDAYVQRLRRAFALCDRYALTSDTRIIHGVAAQFALAAGDLDAAAAHFGRGTASVLDTLGTNPRDHLVNGFELALARERPAEFQAYADTLRAKNLLSGPYRSMLGELGEGNDTTPAFRQNALWRQLLVGVVPAGFDSLERVMTARMNGPTREDFLQLTTLAGVHLRHTGPALDTASDHPLKRAQAFLVRGDTARARTFLSEFDRSLLARSANTPDDGGWLFGAETHLDLGDSLVAFQRLQEFARRWPASIAGAYILEMRYFQSTTPRLWGRTWLLYGDLAMARHQAADARRAYRMVVGLWEHGDPVVQPFVARARAALAQLGS